MSERIDEEEREFSWRSGSYTLNGKIVACPRCGRKILAHARSIDPRTLPSPGAVCLECVELSPQFREQCPEVAAAIDRWVAEKP